MATHRALLPLFLLTIITPAIAAQPLPKGARLRMGSTPMAVVRAPVLAANPAISRDGKYIVADAYGDLTLFDRAAGKPVRKFGLAPGRSVSFAPNGKAIACVGVDQLLIVEVPTGKVLRKISINGSGLPPHACFSADGKTVAIGTQGVPEASAPQGFCLGRGQRPVSRHVHGDPERLLCDRAVARW